MLWPFRDFLFALRVQQPGDKERIAVFPDDCTHPSWVELALYLGRAFRPEWMSTKDEDIHREFQACGSAEAFYHSSERYLYHLVQYFLEGWKHPAYAFLFELLAVNVKQTVLDYGCGTGEDGLWFMANNIKVSFADFDNPCTRFLAWRLDHRLIARDVPVYNIALDVIPHHDIVWCMDVLEHLPPSEHLPFLAKLGFLGRCVIINFVDDKGADGLVHHTVDVEGLTSWLEAHGPCAWKDFHEKPDGSKVRFVLYRLGEEVV